MSERVRETTRERKRENESRENERENERDRERERQRDRERMRETFSCVGFGTWVPACPRCPHSHHLWLLAHSPPAVHYTRVVLVGSLQYPATSNSPSSWGVVVSDNGSLRALTVGERWRDEPKAWVLALALASAFVYEDELQPQP